MSTRLKKAKDESEWRKTLYHIPCGNYHVVFTPKNRRQVIYGQVKRDIEKLCKRKRIEGEMYKDRIHMLIRILPKNSMS